MIQGKTKVAASEVHTLATMNDQADNGKQKRYDRQIRIWGAHGQSRLESCRVALLNCSATGSETLKNLVLGGISSFTVVDGSKVQPSDLGNNFLVEHSNLGESRAKCVTELLKELNDSVAGSYVEEEPDTLITTNPQFFAEFDLVIATQVSVGHSSSCTCHIARRPASIIFLCLGLRCVSQT